VTADTSRMMPVQVGDIVAGKYEVERFLGSGGMGVVVSAKHVRLGERVAIKFLLSHAMKNAEVVKRFLQEGRAAVRIKSEHVGRVIDSDTLPDGTPYIIMEFLEGSDLSTLLKAKGAVPIDVAVEYILQACEAIAEAHSLGIIHRDLKPANLFVTRRADGSPVVKVIDFGISKVADPTTGTDVELTKTDVMMGSPVYMAPEQMISARDVDVRADVWSLGVILFYLLVGTQPFKGASVTQLYAAIIQGAPQLRPSRPEIPPELERAVMKCLQAVPKERFANIAELAAAIADFAPVHARVSADRVSRTLGVTPVPRSTPPPPAVVGSMTPPAISSTGLREGSQSSTGPQTEGSWGGTQGPSQRRRSRSAALMIAAVITVGLTGAGVVFLLRPSQPAGSGAASSSATGAGAIVTPGAAASTPGSTTVTPAASTDAPAVVTAPSSVVSATPSPSASQSASAAVKVPGPRPPGTARPATTKPKGDLFSDPH
jgi:eukaryotic-like serine/threonine-protein kinase